MSYRQTLVQNAAAQKALRSQPVEPVYESALLIVTNATVIGVANQYRWLYTVRFARVAGPAAYGYAAEGTTDMYALSHSELNNTTAMFSWGIVAANLPAGFVPVRIPDGKVAVGVPHTCTDGTFVWLLLNTQQIDGVCP